MYLKTFGGPVLEGSSLRRPKPLLLLGYLAVEGARSRQHLRQMFWPSAADPAASLRVALKQIKEAAPEAIGEENDIVNLQLRSDVADLLTAFRTAPKKVLQIYQGEFFSGFTLENDDEDTDLGNWLYTVREHFAGQVRLSVLNLVEEQVQASDQAAAASLIRQVRYLPGAKPLEAADLHRLYHLATQTGSELRSQLQAEAQEYGFLLMEPQNRTQLPRKLLPPSTTSFIGRHSELRELLSLLQNAEHRVLTIHGVGGIGKTRLALELAHLQRSDRVAFVSLTQATTENIMLMVAQAMHLNLASGVPPLLLITSTIGSEPFTLYLDNYEHLLPDIRAIEELLSACAQLQLVVTSRQRLALAEEMLFPLDGLDVAEGKHSDAARLFLSRATQANARFRAASEDWEAILQICQRLDGSPLAIELAAG